MEEGTKSVTPKSGGKIGDVDEGVECRHGFDDVALPQREHGRLLLGDNDDETKETENSENIRLRQRKKYISVFFVVFVSVNSAKFSSFFDFNSSRNMEKQLYPATPYNLEFLLHFRRGHLQLSYLFFQYFLASVGYSGGFLSPRL